MPEGKRILMVYYSQTGQLDDVLRSLIAPVKASPDFEVTVGRIRPSQPYPFPWSFWRFFNTFPECIYDDPDPIEPVDVPGDADFDLVLLGYQVWFLSPSLPTTAFLQSEQARKWMSGKPVITVIACRNMWLMAQERMKKKLADLGARLIDNVALTDRSHGAVSVITTPLFLLSGKPGPYLGGLLPRAGVRPLDVEGAARFGEAIVREFPRRDAADGRPLFAGLGAVVIHPGLITSEQLVQRSFRLWGALLRACGKPASLLRRAVLALYVAFLVLMLVTAVPVVFLLKTLLSPLTRGRVARQRALFAGPSGE
jgi:hypothetical protein